MCNSNIKPKKSDIDVDLFVHHLHDYPNEAEKHEIIQHLRGYVFDIQGTFEQIGTRYKQITKSAYQGSDVVDKYFIDEMEKGRITCITKEVANGSIDEPIVWIPFTVVNNSKPRCVFNFMV